MDTEEEEMSEQEATATIKNTEVASKAVRETYIRRGLEANKQEDRGETYTAPAQSCLLRPGSSRPNSFQK